MLSHRGYRGTKNRVLVFEPLELLRDVWLGYQVIKEAYLNRQKIFRLLSNAGWLSLILIFTLAEKIAPFLSVVVESIYWFMGAAALILQVLTAILVDGAQQGMFTLARPLRKSRPCIGLEKI